MPKNIPSYKHMFLYRQGLKLEPSRNFIEKFKEIYKQLSEKNKGIPTVELDDNTAIFFINSVVESIIYCLDLGLDVWLPRVMVFLQKKSDYVHTSKKGNIFLRDNIKKLTFKPYTSIVLKIKNKINENNERYQKFIEEKKQNYRKIKKYYKELYGKEEWWREY